MRADRPSVAVDIGASESRMKSGRILGQMLIPPLRVRAGRGGSGAIAAAFIFFTASFSVDALKAVGAVRLDHSI